MKPAGGPTPATAISQNRRTPTEPAASAIDLTRSDTPSYNSQQDQSDRSRKRADPEYQDGRYGFESKEDQMDVDTEAPAPVIQREDHRENRRDDRRDARQDYRRDERGGDRSYAPRDFGRGRYSQNDRGPGRPRDDRRLYSDNLYPRSRGRGFR